jgi:hypothetical protein
LPVPVVVAVEVPEVVSSRVAPRLVVVADPVDEAVVVTDSV